MAKPSQAIQDLVSIFEQTGHALAQADPDGCYPPICEDGGWTCDGGAVFLAYLADRMGLLRELHVGLYWHSDPALLASLRGDDIEDIVPSEMDEHHHWVEVYDPPKRTWWLIDPNGEIRAEPRLQPSTDALAERYAADDSQGVWSGIDSHTDVQRYVTEDPTFAPALAFAQPLLAALAIPAPSPAPAL